MKVGAARYEVSTELVRSGARRDSDSFDPDGDALTKRWFFPTERQAKQFAAELLKRDDLVWGCVTIQRQVVGWSEDGLEWQDAGDCQGYCQGYGVTNDPVV